MNELVSSPSAPYYNVCAERYMVLSAVWIDVVSIPAFNIAKAVNKNGDIIEPSYEYHLRWRAYTLLCIGFVFSFVIFLSGFPLPKTLRGSAYFGLN